MVEKYREKRMSIDQMKSVILDQQVAALNDFAFKCRSEFANFPRSRKLGDSVGVLIGRTFRLISKPT